MPLTEVKGRDSVSVTESRKKANAKWDAANLDRMSLALPKGKKDAIKAAAALAGESMNQYIGNAIDMRMMGAGESETPSSVLTPAVLCAAQAGAKLAGEELPTFVERAVKNESKRDEMQRKLLGK